MSQSGIHRIALVAALLMAGAGYYLLQEYKVRFEAEATGGNKVQVLMVTRNLDTDTRISREMLGVRAIPRAYVDERHIPASQLRAVIGARTSSQLKATESLLWSDLDGNERRARSLANMVGAGKRAITIAASGESVFGGLLQPGDRVDALLTRETGVQGAGTLPLAQNLLVLAVGSRTDNRPAGPAKPDNRAAPRPSSIGTVTLAVSLEQAQELTLARQFGTISLVLRNPDDVRVVRNLAPVNSATLLRRTGADRRDRNKDDLFEKALREALRSAPEGVPGATGARGDDAELAPMPSPSAPGFGRQ
jgi:pilus assembly protein CpaB